jgi:hypothetical protein
MNSQTDNHLLTSALDYSERFGFSVIPCRLDKKPFIKWEPHQSQKATPEEIKAWLQKWQGAMIGIVTGEISGLLVIDCDTKEGYEAIQRLLPDSLLVPTARTPRGGWHLYFIYPKDSGLTVGAGILPGVDFRGQGGYVIAPPSRNGDGKAYTWESGLSLADIAPPALPESVFNILKTNILYRGGEVTSEVTDFKRLQMTSSDFKMFEYGRRDNDLFHTANCLVKGGMPKEEIGQVLEKLIMSWGENPDRKWIGTKIESAFQRVDKREINFSQEVRDFVVTSSGFFLTSDVFNRLQVTSRQEKKNVVLTLLRLQKEGIIERHGQKDGCYRRIESDVEEIDFLAATDDHLNIHYPMKIERYVYTLPKSIIIVAGEPDAGKTALFLNFIRMNQENHDVHYFSSEMGSTELRSRLSKFEYPLKSWRFHAKERAANFADVIQSDAVNIIDFLEIHDEFYKVGGFIKEIFDKLRKGIALIAIQKNKGSDYGLGGTRGLEKARLYLTMGGGQIKIVKAKNWVHETIKPTGLALDFKLAAGCRFITVKDWYRCEK